MKTAHSLWIISCFLLLISLQAEVVPASVFTDHMVLQHGKPVYVWGTADPDEKIKVSLGSQPAVQTLADGKGHWLLELPAQGVTSIPQILRIEGKNAVEIKDVLVGEVWVGSGQSNMGVSTGTSTDWDQVRKEIAAGEFSLVRLIKASWTASEEPLDTLANVRWTPADEANLKGFSAALFYFARALKRTNPEMPIGLIQSSVGGTNAHAWLPPETLREGRGTEPIRRWYQEQLDKLPEENKVYAKKLEQHEIALAKAKQNGSPNPRPPEPPMGPESRRRPASLYNGMVAPLQPFAMRGVIWYQGENNGSLQWAPWYAALMDDLINGWRHAWYRKVPGKQPEDFPFLIVQLPNFKKRPVWPLLREQQETITRQTRQTAIVCTIDVGDPDDIHPRNKTPVGERLALAARAMVYGEKDIVWSGPRYSGLSTGGKFITVEFAHVGGGLKTNDGQAPRGFEIAGEDQRFFPAKARISGSTVILESPEVPSPRAVRYAWKDNPEGLNFYNAEGLPAFPFRSDDWNPAP